MWFFPLYHLLSQSSPFLDRQPLRSSTSSCPSILLPALIWTTSTLHFLPLLPTLEAPDTFMFLLAAFWLVCVWKKSIKRRQRKQSKCRRWAEIINVTLRRREMFVVWCGLGGEIFLWGGLKVGCGAPRGIKRNNSNPETRGKLRICRQTVDTCRWVSASVLRRLQGSRDTCCPLAFLLSNGNSLHWFIFFPVRGNCRHFCSSSSRELYNEKREAVNQYFSLLQSQWGQERNEEEWSGESEGNNQKIINFWLDIISHRR